MLTTGELDIKEKVAYFHYTYTTELSVVSSPEKIFAFCLELRQYYISVVPTVVISIFHVYLKGTPPRVLYYLTGVGGGSARPVCAGLKTHKDLQ